MSYKEALTARDRALIALHKTDNWDDKKRAMKHVQSVSLQLHAAFIQQSNEIQRMNKLGDTEEQISTALDIPVFFVNKILTHKQASASSRPE